MSPICNKVSGMRVLNKIKADLDVVESGLNRLADRYLSVKFWWRDDGANEPTRALDRLLTIQSRTQLPLNLAVIPNALDPLLGREIASNMLINVWQLGAAHVSYDLPEQPKNEFPEHRRWTDIAYDIGEANGRLAQVFGAQLAPVFVPPWGVMALAHTYGLSGMGFAALSTTAPIAILQVAALPDIPVQFSVMRLQGYPRFGGRTALSTQLTQMLDNQAQLASLRLPREMIGIKTQHLDHDDAAWDFTYELLMLLKQHPAVSFVAAPWEQQQPIRAAAARLRLLSYRAQAATTPLAA